MDTSLQETDDAPSIRASVPPLLPLRHRLAISAVVTGFSLWIRAVELTGESRHRRVM
jgi:hypothetical protein